MNFNMKDKHVRNPLSMFLFALVGFIVHIHADDEPPSILDNFSNTVMIYEGDDALLTCVVRNMPDDATLMWKKEESSGKTQRILTAMENRITSDKRFAVLHDDPPTSKDYIRPGGDVWVLAINNVKPTDSGVYICEINSRPVVRSFHKLNVLSRDLQPPGNTSMEPVIFYDDSQKSKPKAHNYTDCCAAANVSRPCLGFCNIQNILDGTTGTDPENCETDFPAIVKCMADYRNHVPCCQQQGIPDLCQDVCRGEYTVITDNIKTHFSCSAYTEQTLACVVQGIELLPSPPQNIEVDQSSVTSLNVTWEAPVANAQSIEYYVVNLTSLKSFDEVFREEKIRNNSKEHQEIHIKVPKNNYQTTINNLLSYTMYEVSITSVNKHGSSLPSYTVRALTQTPQGKRGAPKEPPKLPDVKGCCRKKGVSHASCVDRLCDPVHASEVEITDIMICAPWAGDTFKCLTNGLDHTPCCKARGLPDLCLNLCSGNVTQLDFNYFKCIKYMSQYSNCLMQSYGVLPSAPNHVHLTNVATDYAILHWLSPKTLGDTVTHYTIYYRELTDDNPDPESYKTISGVKNSPYILESLDTETDYEVYVAAENVHGSGEPSSRIVFRTKSLISEEKAEEASFYNVTACCAEAKLTNICMPLCTYDASMKDVKVLAGQCVGEFHKLLKCGAGGRNHGKCCSRRGVPANCLSLCSGILAESPLITATSCLPFVGNIVQCFEEGTGLLPGPVEELHGFTVENNSVTIEWKPPSDGSNVTGYSVHFQKVDNTSIHEMILKLDHELDTSNTYITLNDLDPLGIYNIFVISQNQHGTSLPSSILMINITQIGLGKHLDAILSPPHSLAIASHSATWVTIAWQPPEFSHPSELITYRLYYKTIPAQNFTIANTTLTSHMLDKLQPNTPYIIYVTAISSKGQSAPSETLVAWTDPAYPAFVEPPAVHPINLVMEGNSMTVLCIAMGTPTPTISLYVSGRLVRQETTRHMVTVIHNVTRDMDQISCYADNGYGAPMQASRKINISHIPHIQASGITLATRGTTVKLECNVDALPEPRMIFWRDPVGRVPVIQSNKFDISTIIVKDEPAKYIMRLTINKISDMDEGDYYCHAENAFGSATQAVSVRLRNVAPSSNVTQCCMEQNVTASCMDACSFYVDLDAVIDRPQCITDFDKLMKCAADGSDHRNCCAQSGVPRQCLDWCRGEPLDNNKICLLSYTKLIMSCFHEGSDKLPGPPLNVKVEIMDASSAKISWTPPVKNPHTVELYRVLWRPVGSKTLYKSDTSNTSLTIYDLKENAVYECVIKAGNHLGTSTLTQAVQFTMGDKTITSATSLTTDGSGSGVLMAVLMALLIVAAILGGAVWFIRTNKLIRLKNLGGGGGVAFENPSYLREVNMDNISNATSSQLAETTNGAISNGLAVSQTSGGHGWKQETLHVPAGSHEVNPTLYEELKLGSDGAGFKRLKP